MSMVFGRFNPPTKPVSISDGKAQIEFSTPAELVRWYDGLDRNGEMRASITSGQWFWVASSPEGGH